ncbi:MAG TPA: NAD(P)-dependent oxidoreductase [Steroidobacteraceae bacterium]|jgi:citronellol/citronellal dehydrogenase|nr:NAD(P)-dependent oxidoreductase [Steroidobacteraceae bacterium]
MSTRGPPASLAGKTLFITGASRGIGLAIALRAARDGANVAIAAKTDAPHPKLAGTIHTAAAEIERAGGRSLALVVDVRDEETVAAAVRRCVEKFGGIDICVNNASAINLGTTEQIDMRRYDLIQQINTRGTFVTTRACLPYLKRAANPHVLTLSPPLELRPRWFAQHLAYSLSKYGMSLCMLGMAEEYRAAGIACNSLWPRTLIATAAVEFLLGGAAMLRRARRPEIVADAAHVILTRPARECSGQFFIDDSVLYEAGVRDFARYSVEAGAPLLADLFIPPESPAPPGVSVEFAP